MFYCEMCEQNNCFHWWQILTAALGSQPNSVRGLAKCFYLFIFILFPCKSFQKLVFINSFLFQGIANSNWAVFLPAASSKTSIINSHSPVEVSTILLVYSCWESVQYCMLLYEQVENVCRVALSNRYSRAQLLRAQRICSKTIQTCLIEPSATSQAILMRRTNLTGVMGGTAFVCPSTGVHALL